ncbi:MAG: peptide-methionine (R)-S-oxide reductase MsrB [Bacteroidota bacterium]
MIRIFSILGFSFLLLSSSCYQAQTVKDDNQKKIKTKVVNDQRFADITLVPVEKSEEEWAAILSNEEFRILRKKGTERAFTGKYWDNKATGTYHCSGCELPLFTSETKFRSGTGWPSFYEPTREDFIKEEEDNAFGWSRVEILCAQCDGHLGHVFEDGPPPTGLRYCVNGNILEFVPSKEN